MTTFEQAVAQALQTAQERGESVRMMSFEHSVARALQLAQEREARSNSLPVGKSRCACGAVLDWNGPPCACANERDKRSAAQQNERFLARAYATIPRAMSWCRLEDELFEKRIKPTTRVWVTKWSRRAGSVVLTGRTGIGKTIAAVALLHRVLDSARDGKASQPDLRWASRSAFVSAQELAIDRRTHPLGEEAPLVERSKHASLLVLDEVGFEVFQPERDTSLFEVLDQRYKQSSPTIVTTALNEQQLRKRYGEALVRRLLDVGKMLELSNQ